MPSFSVILMIGALVVGGILGGGVKSFFDARTISDLKAQVATAQKETSDCTAHYEKGIGELNQKSAAKIAELEGKLAEAHDIIAADRRAIAAKSQSLGRILNGAPKGDARVLGPTVRRYLGGLRGKPEAGPP